MEARIVMKLPEFNLFSNKSAQIFLFFSKICPNFHGFLKLGGGAVAPPLPLSRTPMFKKRHIQKTFGSYIKKIVIE